MPIFDTTIFVASEYKSILQFKINSNNYNNQLLEEDESLSCLSENQNTSIFSELFSEDEDNNLNELVNNEHAHERDFISNEKTHENDSQNRESSPMRKLTDTSSLDEIDIESLIIDENQNPNNEPSPPQHTLQASMFKEIYNNLDNDLKNNFNVELIIKSNILLIGKDVHKVTKLNELVYSQNSKENFNFANIIGIIKHFNITKNNRRVDLTIYDETVENFEIQLGCLDIDTVRNNFKQTEIVTRFFPYNYFKEYPNFKSGALICIRDLCLAANSINICPHPNQLLVC